MLELDERRFNRLALSILVVSFVVLIICFGAGFVALTSSNQSKLWVDHTYQVISEVAQLEVSIERSETASRGYLLSPEPVRLQTFRQNMANVDPSLARLSRLIADNPIQRINVAVLRRQTDAELAALNQLMTLALSSGVDPARNQFRRDAKLRRVNAIRVQAAAIRAIEERLLVKRTAAARRDFRLSELVLGVAGVFLIILAVGATWLVRRYTVDLAAAQARLHVLNSDLEGAVADRTKELSLANDEIQRFAYIVSHDLRSPLVNVMGFTAELLTANQHIGRLIDRVEAERPELLGEDARLAAREDLPEAIGFIRSSTQKMDRLINAILKLSREGRRSLTPEPIAMAGLIETIRDSLQHRLQETGSTILVGGTLPDLVSDRLALEQIFSNLIENGIKYLKVGVPGKILVTGEVSDGRTVYSVADNGRGIDTRDHQRIFDLFRRSGTQDKAGEGIGLAHVRSLAYRLGGIIEVESALGEGATFLLSLPSVYSDQGAST